MIKLLQQFLFVIVLLPALGVSGYVAFGMTDRYATEAGIMIKRQAQGPTVSGLGAALGFGDAAANEDERILLAYIMSPDLLRLLDAELDVREHYSDDAIDRFSRLGANASREEFLRFYQDLTNVRQDESTGLLNIEVQAFDPEFSQQMMELILQYSEAFVNEVSLTLAEQQVEFMRGEVLRAQDVLRAEKEAVVRFQNLNRVLSPQGQGQALTSIINTLQSDLIQQETQLSQYQSYLNPDAPQVVSTRARIQALEQEIERQRQRMGGENGENFSELNAQYANLELNLEFATNNYTTSLNAFELARAESSRKLRNLVMVTSPQLADEAQYPKKIYWIITWLLGASLVYGIMKLVLSIVREHVD